MEKISALIDGELEEREARQQFSRLNQAEELAHDWAMFHLIGDAMRGERPLSQGFGERLGRRLAEEPTVLAPRPIASKRFAAYALSAAASLSAVALVGWMALFNSPLTPQPDAAPQAQNSAVPVAEPAPTAQLASVPSEGTMNEYLIAHQEFSPSTEIQGLAPYIRGVSSTQQDKGR
jgi:sigma-E factor negative regulatory protein RseA